MARAAADGLKNIINFLECSICLHKYDNPKQLSCSHQYCKQCLDDLLVFSGDGSAQITCPNRCKQLTFVTKHQTTDDLGGCYEFKGILEALQALNNNGSDTSPPQGCHFGNGSCCNDVVLYCCGVRMCKTCSSKHKESSATHFGTTDIILDKNDRTFKALCKEHSTPCTHVCYEHGFLCIYCVHRSHQGHKIDTIDNEAAELREIIMDGVKKFEYVDSVRELTHESIIDCEKKLEQSLRERKISCLFNYLSFLEKEEEAVKKHFSNICGDLYESLNPPTSLSDHQNKLQKNDTEIIIEKNEIVHTLSRQPPLKRVTVFFNGKCSFDNHHPLGELQVSANYQSGQPHPLCSSFNSAISQPDNYQDILPVLSTKFELLKINKPTTQEKTDSSINKSTQTQAIYNSSKSTQTESQHNSPCMKMKSTQTQCKLNSSIHHKSTQIHYNIQQQRGEDFNNCVRKYLLNKTGFVKTLIKTEENEMLKQLLAIQPDITQMKDTVFKDRTMLHYAAACDNVSAMKILVEQGSYLDTVDRDGFVALHTAVLNNSKKCVRWLVVRDVFLLSKQDNYGNSPLHVAAYSGSLDSLRLCLTFGAHVETINKYGETAIHLARTNRNQDCVNELCYHGGDLPNVPVDVFHEDWVLVIHQVNREVPLQ